MSDDDAEETETLSETLRRQTHADGTPVFTTATCFSLLVFYVLAMQCLPTQAVTRRETGHWGWAVFQLVYMTLLAWTAAFLTFQSLSAVDNSTGPETAGPPNMVDSHNDRAGHAHPSEGPHHGDLIELGNEEYDAEILHDEDAGTVTIYVLNGAATEQVPIDATKVTINAKHDGKPEQFTLAASPDASDPQGKCSRFVSNDEELAHHLDEEGAEPRLVLTINGKSYRGVITHDHAGHDQ